VASSLENQPPPDHEQFPNGENRPTDRFVVSGQPKRKVDVRVIRAILCVAICQINQRAAAPVHSKDRALDQYQPSQKGGQAKLTPGSSEGNRHNASSKEEPNRGVQELYSCQGGHSLRLGFHREFQFRRFIESMDNNSAGRLFATASAPNSKLDVDLLIWSYISRAICLCGKG
jgi:hypothetical protein